MLPGQAHSSSPDAHREITAQRPTRILGPRLFKSMISRVVQLSKGGGIYQVNGYYTTFFNAYNLKDR
jgi:hypothetical protein